MSVRTRKSARRKPPPRWRRYLTQAELDLPPPAATVPLQDGAPQVDDDLDVDDEEPIEWWQTRPAVAGLAVLAALLLIATIVALRASSQARSDAAAARAQVRLLTLRAVSGEQALHLEPNHLSWSTGPDAVIAWPEPPQLLELFVPVGYTGFQAFALVVDKVDYGRVVVLERLVPDSNRDLRVGLNSSALGPGEYRLRVQGYTWRGQRVDIGWIRLQVNAR
jgi:hypothetical protein